MRVKPGLPLDDNLVEALGCDGTRLISKVSIVQLHGLVRFIGGQEAGDWKHNVVGLTEHGQVPMILAGIPEQSDLSGYWPHDLSDAAAQTPQGCPTSGEELLPIKKEFIMESNCRVVLVAKLIKRMETSFNKGSKVLPELSVGDRVRVQNRTTLRMIRWDKTGMVMKKLREGSTRSSWAAAAESL